jgi:DNA-binding LacI/PurR family transcriptional regulator
MKRKTRAPTSYDVAAHAGVSQSAVSRAFHTASSIAPETRARILSSAKALGYLPNAVARSLITKRSGLAAVLVTEATQRDAPDVLYFICQALISQGFQPLLFPMALESEGGEALAQAMAFGVDGIVSCMSLSVADIDHARLHDRPLVLFNRMSPRPETSAVACDHAEASGQLASRLFAAGHRRFAVVAGPADAPVSSLRVTGFLSRLKELGVENVIEIAGDYHYESGYAAAFKLFSTTPLAHERQEPEVVFCVNDAMALGMLDAVRFGLMRRVPRDVSIVGFDDVPTGRRPAYLLTTVSQPFEAMAQLAVQILRSQIDDANAPHRRELLQGKLVERNSALLLPVEMY